MSGLSYVEDLSCSMVVFVRRNADVIAPIDAKMVSVGMSLCL